MVWHHRRDSVRAYWRQQVGYGKAEALLERKWPEKYNSVGHISWWGRLYGKGFTLPLPWPSNSSRVYHGTWGSALFQSLYQPVPGALSSLPLMPEWYLAIPVLAALAALGFFWSPLLLALPLLVLAVVASLVQAGLSASRASFASPTRSRLARAGLLGLTTLLHLLQPAARLWGRLRHGLSPWRVRIAPRLGLPRVWVANFWSEQWQAAEARLGSVEAVLHARRQPVLRGGDFDDWDLEVRTGLFGTARTLMTVEEHGGGKQLVRFRTWPRPKGRALGRRWS